MVAGEIAFRYGDKGLPEGTIEINFKGSVGQSLGAFSVDGIRFILEGEANDYVGKGMHGGELIIKPPLVSKFLSHKNVIIGNTVMYGATGGNLYAAGCGGESFCVRNSGGNAVVEGLGDHGCEYTSGGTVEVLGNTGRNFGAGITGGMAYVLDEDESFPTKYHTQFVMTERAIDQKDIDVIKFVITKHFDKTGSKRAEEILDNWTNHISLFCKVMPLESLKLAKAQKDPGKEKVKVQISKEDQPGAVAMSGDPVSDLKH